MRVYPETKHRADGCRSMNPFTRIRNLFRAYRSYLTSRQEEARTQDIRFYRALRKKGTDYSVVDRH